MDRSRETNRRRFTLYSLDNELRVKGACLTARKLCVLSCSPVPFIRIYTNYLQLDSILPIEIQRIVTFSREDPRVADIDIVSSMVLSRTSLRLLTNSHDVIIEVAVVRR